MACNFPALVKRTGNPAGRRACLIKRLNYVRLRIAPHFAINDTTPGLVKLTIDSQQSQQPLEQTLVAAFYRFVTLVDYRQLRKPLLMLLEKEQIKGTILLAEEGVNGTIAGDPAAIEKLFAWFDQDARLANLNRKYSWHQEPPFYRTKVRLKKEIVTLGVDGIDPGREVGAYIKPNAWNHLIKDPDLLLIDTRNDYEVEVGTYQGAVNPGISSFRELPDYLERHLSGDKKQKIAMFCTGGIRCEKSTAYLRKQGYENVYHLEGGILKYLEEVDEADSLWQGDCFVFDRRVAVNHQLQKGEWEECRACRMPLSEKDRSDPHYQPGLSCHHCFDQQDQRKRQRVAQREKQVDLARERGETHLGGRVNRVAESRRQVKRLVKQQAKQQ